MVDRQGGNRRKTRHKLSKGYADKGKISIRRFLAQYNPGTKVALIAEPSYQKGMYFRRFHGMTGTVKRKNGTCYDVEINDQGITKIVIVHPIHLKQI